MNGWRGRHGHAETGREARCGLRGERVCGLLNGGRVATRGIRDGKNSRDVDAARCGDAHLEEAPILLEAVELCLERLFEARLLRVVK